LTEMTEGLAKLRAIKEEARRLAPRRHRAAWDVEYLIQVWKLTVWRAR